MKRILLTLAISGLLYGVSYATPGDGDDKGKTGEVLQVLPKVNKVIVKDCKVAKKTVKPDQEKNPDGGFINKEMPIDISNVAKVEG